MAKKIALTDKFFVQVYLNKKAEKSVKKKWKVEKETQLLKRYPYLTFLETEKLFEALCEEGTTIDSLAIARLDSRGKPTIEDEVRIEHFTLDEEYENLLRVFSEALLNDSKYTSIKFEEKIDYLEKSIFPAYQESTRCDESQLALLPEVIEDEFMECPVPFYNSTLQVEPTIEASPVTNANTHELDSEAYPIESTEQEEEHLEKTDDVQPNPTIEERSLEGSNTSLPRSHESYSPPILASHSLTYFEHPVPKVLEPYHSGYIDNEVAKIKMRFNQQIKKIDTQLQAEQGLIYSNKKEQLEEAKHRFLQAWLKENDKRHQFKLELLAEGKAELQNRETSLLESLKSNENFELNEAKLAYERKVKEIRVKYKNENQIAVDHLREEMTFNFEERYKNQFLLITEELQKSLVEQELFFDEKNNKELEKLSSAVNRIVQSKDHELKTMYQKELTAQIPKIEQIHREALVNKRELDKTEAIQSFKAEVNQVKNHTEYLEKELKKSKETQENLLASAAPRAPQVFNSFKDETLSANENSDQNIEKLLSHFQEKESSESSLGKLAVVALPVLALVSLCGYWIFQMAL